jgi:hypothetical protein
LRCSVDNSIHYFLTGRIQKNKWIEKEFLMETKSNRPEKYVGTAVITGLITGFAGLFAAVVAFIYGEWVGAALCLLASALAFGLQANALLRD